jgi:hypothetical protein
MQIHIERPRLGVPACLLVDDPAPCINPLYYYRLQVDGERYERHERTIPLDFMEQFVDTCQARGIRGKFTILPYPAGLGSILKGLEGYDRGEMERWLGLARTGLTAQFDITPEILTHTLALDLKTGTMLPQSEHEWMVGRTRDELVEYMSAALKILKEAGFSPSGITQPVNFKGSRPDFVQAVLESIQNVGGPAVTFYFLDDYLGKVPVPPLPIDLLDRQRGKAVLSMVMNADEYFWPTQRLERPKTGWSADQVANLFPSALPGMDPESQNAGWVADHFIAADGRSGRLVELADSGGWLVLCCHWQSLYSDGSRQGLAGLDKVAERLSQTLGPRLIWMKPSEIACYRAASEGCQIDPLPDAGSWTFTLDAAFDCPDFTFTLQSPDLAGGRVNQVTWQVAGEEPRPLAQANDMDGLLSPGAWRQEGDRLSLCVRLQRGVQVVRLLSHVSPAGV